VLCLQLPAISNSPLIKHLTSSYSILLSQFEYTYDADGQIQSWTQQADAGTPKTSVLAYDPVAQLLTATVRSNGMTGAALNRVCTVISYAIDRRCNSWAADVIRSVCMGLRLFSPG
jgi:hypothetical protein